MAASPAAPRPTPVSFSLPAAVATPLTQQMSQRSTNPIIMRALQASQLSSFPATESKWTTAKRIMSPFVPVGGDPEDYAHIHADLGRPADIVAKLSSITKLSDISSNQDSTFITDVLLASVDEYFVNHAKDDVKRCWPNLRSMIQMTSATTDDEDNVHHGCFNSSREATLHAKQWRTAASPITTVAVSSEPPNRFPAAVHHCHRRVHLCVVVCKRFFAFESVQKRRRYLFL